MTGPRAGTLALLPVAALLWTDLSLAQEDPRDIVAAAVRQRGHQCVNPQSAERDLEHSEPDQMAWILQCENGSFRVKFKGDTGAEVEPLGE